MKKKIDLKFIVLILIIIGSFIYFAAPVHQYNINVSKIWWQGWYLTIQENLFPNERGLNVAVLDYEGNFIKAKAFDTYYYADSGFPAYISSLPENSWVIVAAMGEAANNLSEEDILALKGIGGSDQLLGKLNYAYILVGYVGLGEGNGLEVLDEIYLHIELEEETIIGDVSLPINMDIYSIGSKADLESYALINTGNRNFKNLGYWIDVVIKRI